MNFWDEDTLAEPLNSMHLLMGHCLALGVTTQARVSRECRRFAGLCWMCTCTCKTFYFYWLKPAAAASIQLRVRVGSSRYTVGIGKKF